MDDSLSSCEHHKLVLIWELIPIKPNWYIIHSADYKDRYISTFFNHWNFEGVFVEQTMPLKWDKGKSGKLSVFRVLTYVEPGCVIETGQVCTDGHLREENRDRIFHIMKYP